jgi:hypothetical protein
MPEPDSHAKKDLRFYRELGRRAFQKDPPPMSAETRAQLWQLLGPMRENAKRQAFDAVKRVRREDLTRLAREALREARKRKD